MVRVKKTARMTTLRHYPTLNARVNGGPTFWGKADDSSDESNSNSNSEADSEDDERDNQRAGPKRSVMPLGEGEQGRRDHAISQNEDPEMRAYLDAKGDDRADAVTKAFERENRMREEFAAMSNENNISSDQPMTPTPTSLSPYVSLVPVFLNEQAFVHQPYDANNQNLIFPLSASEYVSLADGGTPAVVSRSEFQENFEIFTEGQLRYVNWDNVVVSGGSVLACLTPIPKKHARNHTTKRRFFHELKYGGSDLDLFVYGLSEEDATLKLRELYFAIHNAIPVKDVVVFRTRHAITIVSEYPYRHVQIVLRVYQSPSEILAGFDVDASSILYNGVDVWCTPRAHNAIITRSNIVDMSRRSPTYEHRLAKYAMRGYSVYVPTLQRVRIDPAIYEKPVEKLEGLPKLLFLEAPQGRQIRNLFNGVQPGEFRNATFGAAVPDMEASDYSSVFLPWGIGHTATSVQASMHTKDMLLNSPLVNPPLPGELPRHRHVCFSGTLEHVIKDPCGSCPPEPEKIVDDTEADRNDEEGDADDAEESDMRDIYVSGPLSWLLHNAGQQSRVGSFHPITEGDWSAGTYIKENVGELLCAISRDDMDELARLLESPETDVEARDVTRRTPLMVACIMNKPRAVEMLLKHGARLCERMEGGRTAIHLAASYAGLEVIRLLLARGAEVNALLKEYEAEKEKRREIRAKKFVVPEPEDDDYRDSDYYRQVSAMRKKLAKAEARENARDAKKGYLDRLQLESEDKERCMTALMYAVLFGRAETVQCLIQEGNANVVKKWIFTGEGGNTKGFNILRVNVREPLVSMSLLQLAAVADNGNNVATMQALLEGGALVNEIDSKGRTLLEILAAGRKAFDPSRAGKGDLVVAEEAAADEEEEGSERNGSNIGKHIPETSGFGGVENSESIDDFEVVDASEEEPVEVAEPFAQCMLRALLEFNQSRLQKDVDEGVSLQLSTYDALFLSVSALEVAVQHDNLPAIELCLMFGVPVEENAKDLEEWETNRNDQVQFLDNYLKTIMGKNQINVNNNMVKPKVNNIMVKPKANNIMVKPKMAVKKSRFSAASVDSLSSDSSHSSSESEVEDDSDLEDKEQQQQELGSDGGFVTTLPAALGNLTINSERLGDVATFVDAQLQRRGQLQALQDKSLQERANSLRNTLVSSEYPGSRGSPHAANVLSVAVEVSVNPAVLKALLDAGTMHVINNRRKRGVPESVAPVSADLISNRVFYADSKEAGRRGLGGRQRFYHRSAYKGRGRKPYVEDSDDSSSDDDNAASYSKNSSQPNAADEKDETCLDILLDRINLLLKYQRLLRSEGTKAPERLMDVTGYIDMLLKRTPVCSYYHETLQSYLKEQYGNPSPSRGDEARMVALVQSRRLEALKRRSDLLVEMVNMLREFGGKQEKEMRHKNLNVTSIKKTKAVGRPTMRAAIGKLVSRWQKWGERKKKKTFDVFGNQKPITSHEPVEPGTDIRGLLLPRALEKLCSPESAIYFERMLPRDRVTTEAWDKVLQDAREESESSRRIDYEGFGGYLALYDAVCAEDTETVKRITSIGAPRACLNMLTGEEDGTDLEDLLVVQVACVSQLGETPVELALRLGRTKMVALLMDVAVKQCHSLPEFKLPPRTKTKTRPLDMAIMSNTGNDKNLHREINKAVNEFGMSGTEALEFVLDNRREEQEERDAFNANKSDKLAQQMGFAHAPGTNNGSMEEGDAIEAVVVADLVELARGETLVTPHELAVKAAGGITKAIEKGFHKTVEAFFKVLDKHELRVVVKYPANELLMKWDYSNKRQRIANEQAPETLLLDLPAPVSDLELPDWTNTLLGARETRAKWRKDRQERQRLYQAATVKSRKDGGVPVNIKNNRAPDFIRSQKSYQQYQQQQRFNFGGEESIDIVDVDYDMDEAEHKHQRVLLECTFVVDLSRYLSGHRRESRRYQHVQTTRLVANVHNLLGAALRSNQIDSARWFLSEYLVKCAQEDAVAKYKNRFPTWINAVDNAESNNNNNNNNNISKEDNDVHMKSEENEGEDSSDNKYKWVISSPTLVSVLVESALNTDGELASDAIVFLMSEPFEIIKAPKPVSIASFHGPTPEEKGEEQDNNNKEFSRGDEDPTQLNTAFVKQLSKTRAWLMDEMILHSRTPNQSTSVFTLDSILQLSMYLDEDFRKNLSLSNRTLKLLHVLLDTAKAQGLSRDKIGDILSKPVTSESIGVEPREPWNISSVLWTCCFEIQQRIGAGQMPKRRWKLANELIALLLSNGADPALGQLKITPHSKAPKKKSASIVEGDCLPLHTLVSVQAKTRKDAQGIAKLVSRLIDAGARPDMLIEGCNSAVALAIKGASGANFNLSPQGVGFLNAESTMFSDTQASIVETMFTQLLSVSGPQPQWLRQSNAFAKSLACLPSSDEALTPLMLATRCPESLAKAIIALLLKNNADATARDHLGRTALHHAAMANSFQAVRAILASNAASPESLGLNMEDYTGRTPADLCMSAMTNDFSDESFAATNTNALGVLLGALESIAGSRSSFKIRVLAKASAVRAVLMKDMKRGAGGIEKKGGVVIEPTGVGAEGHGEEVEVGEAVETKIETLAMLMSAIVMQENTSKIGNEKVCNELLMLLKNVDISVGEVLERGEIVLAKCRSDVLQGFRNVVNHGF